MKKVLIPLTLLFMIVLTACTNYETEIEFSTYEMQATSINDRWEELSEYSLRKYNGINEFGVRGTTIYIWDLDFRNEFQIF
jgi:hypothetical protein